MTNFYWYVPTEVFFGEGQLKALNTAVSRYGKKVLVIYDGFLKDTALYHEVMSIFTENDCKVWEVTGIEPNPRIGPVRESVKLCKEHGIDFVVAIGGGSTIDTGKIVSCAAKSEADAWDVLTNPKLIQGNLPLCVVVTIAATGSEMDPIAVISDPVKNVKQGTYDHHYFPKMAIMDPKITMTVPKRQTAAGSADMMSHFFENYFSHVKGAYMQHRVAEGFLKTIIHYAPIACADPTNYEARANLLWCAPWGMNGINRLGNDAVTTVHSLANTLSAHYDTTHGVALAILTPYWMEYALNDKTLFRFVEYGVNVWDIDPALPEYEIAKTAIKKTREFFNSIGLPATLGEVGVGAEKLEIMAQQAATPDQLEAFVPLDKEAALKIYTMAL